MKVRRRNPLLSFGSEFRSRALVLATALCIGSSCTPTSQHYEIHTPELTCDEANRFVHDAVVGLGRVITGFKLAKPGEPGYVRVKQGETGAEPAATVKITCDAAGAHIVTDEGGLSSDKRLSRGVYLSVTGRAGLSANKHQEAAAVKSESVQKADALEGKPSAVAPPPARRRVEEKKAKGVVLELAPVYGFATVLDFEADLSAAGVLPVKVTLTNATSRVYEFDPADITLRQRGSRQRARPMTPTQVVGKLEATAARLESEEGDGSGEAATDGAASLGDIDAAAGKVKELRLRPVRMNPGLLHSGFLYYPLAEYDRARLTLIDVATGETEGFLVDF